MSFSISFKPLFEVNILHKYFLNIGALDFWAMDDEIIAQQLARFELARFFSVVPTAACSRKLKGQNLVFRATNTGFAVWARVAGESEFTPLVPISDKLELTFLLHLTDPLFLNYTALDLANVGKLFFFSNQRLPSEDGDFPLIKRTTAQHVVNNRYVLNDESSKLQLAQISNSEKARLFGIVRIAMKGETAALDVTTTQQKLRKSHRVFQLMFDNRKTLWRYIFSKAQTVSNTDDVEQENGSTTQLLTKNEYPLTKNGFVSVELGGKELPNPEISLIKPGNGANKIYSEIYVSH